MKGDKNLNNKEYSYEIHYSDEVGVRSNSIVLTHEHKYTSEEFNRMVQVACEGTDLVVREVAANLIINEGFMVNPIVTKVDIYTNYPLNP